MSKIQDYIEALEILKDSDYEQRELIFEVAKVAPAALVKAFHSLNGEDRVKAIVRRVYEEGGKIAAIKEYRNQTGEGLRESKDYVEVNYPDLERENRRSR